MTKHARRRRAYPLAALVGAALTFTAVPAAQAATVHCGDTITVNTTVSNNLANCSGDGLTFGANGIVLNLNGHTIDGVDTGKGINFAGYNHDTVTNGKVTDFQYGVYGDGDDNTISKVATASSEYGIDLEYANRNRVTQSQGNTGLDGVTEDYGHGNRLDGVSAAGNSRNGITIYGTDGRSGGTTLINSTATNNGEFGIYAYYEFNDLITKNVATGNGRDGFYFDYLDGTSQITSNTATANHGDGFDVQDSYEADGLLLQGNHATKNQGDGFYQAYGPYSVKFLANNAQANGGDGFHIYDTNGTTLQNNIAGSPSALSGGGGGNSTGIYAEVVDNLLVKGNSAHGNTSGDGIHTDSGTNIDIRDNKTNHNARDGIDDESGNATFTSNLADYNVDFGLFAAPGDTDGGGNAAHHNGTNCSPTLGC